MLDDPFTSQDAFRRRKPLDSIKKIESCWKHTVGPHTWLTLRRPAGWAIVRKIREGGDDNRTKALYDELDQINDYTASYHHGEVVAHAAPEEAHGENPRNGWPDNRSRIGEHKAKLLRSGPMPVRTCRVSCWDAQGVEHTAQVTARSLYEAVAQALRVFREDEWSEDPHRGPVSVVVTINQPQVEHKVRIKDFENWLESAGKSPAEMALKSRLREIIQR